MECSGINEQIKGNLVDYRLNSLKTNECGIRETHYEIILPKFLHISQLSTAVSLIDMLNKLRESHHNHLEHYQLNTSSIFGEFLISLSRELTSGFLYYDKAVSMTRSTRIIYDLLSFFQSSYAAQITGKILEENTNAIMTISTVFLKKLPEQRSLPILTSFGYSRQERCSLMAPVKFPKQQKNAGFGISITFQKFSKNIPALPPVNFPKEVISTGRPLSTNHN